MRKQTHATSFNLPNYLLITCFVDSADVHMERRDPPECYKQNTELALPTNLRHFPAILGGVRRELLTAAPE